MSVQLGAETSGIDAALAPWVGPETDLSVDAVVVESVPLRTDHGDLGPSPLSRTVRVAVSNLGANKAWYAYLVVEACPFSYGGLYCRQLGSEYVTLDAGSTLQRTFPWAGAGMAGDVLVRARLSYGGDTNGANNEAATAHYVLVGGTGVGVGL